MTDFENTFSTSVQAILGKTKGYTGDMAAKFKQMEQIYLQRNNHLYDTKQTADIQNWGNATRYKFLSTSFCLEELWALSMNKRISIFDQPSIISQTSEWDDDEMVIGVIYLETFLFHARSFLDIYMLYVCLLLNRPDPGLMSVKNFNKQIKSCENTFFETKANKIKFYFDTKVIVEGAWGDLLRKFRDKIAHREPLKPSRQGNETIVGILLNWPTISGYTFERFGQNFHNGIFTLIQDTAPILFDLEWISGPYNANMWQ